MSTSLALPTPRTSVIKRIQRGSITLSAVSSGTLTITSVDTTKTKIEILGGGFTAVEPLEPASYHWEITLTDATTITARLGGAGSYSGATNLRCNVQATEYY